MPRSLRSLCLCLSLIPVLGCPRPDDEIVIAPQEAPPADPQLVEFSSSLSKPTLDADHPQELFARMRVSGKKFPGNGRPAVNLALALDASGSMEGKALADSKAAATAMLDRLEDGDRVAIVAFGGRTELLFGSQPLNPATRELAKQAIADMQARGTTDMLGGMSQALAEVQRNLLSDGVNRIVLLSDGVPNDVNGITNIAQQAQNSKITITALGLGLEFDETLLTQLSQQSGGRYHYLEDSDQALAVFDEELLHMERSVARGMGLSLRAGPGVQILEVIGHPGAAQGASASVALGDLADDETRDVVVRLRVPAHVEGTHAELLDAFLNFEDVAVGAQYLSREDYLSASVGEEVSEKAKTAALEVETGAQRSIAAAAIVEVAAMAREGRLAEAASRLAQARTAAEEAAKNFDDAGLRELVEEMKHLAETWPSQGAAIAVDAATQPVSVNEERLKKEEMMAEELGRDEMHAPGRPMPAPTSPPDARSMRRSHAKAVQALH